MQRTRKTLSNLIPILPHVVGSFLLCVYVATATPILPVLTALLGSTDRSHHVALQQTAQGVQVVLRHECANLLAHRHGVVARALTLLAQRSTTGADHVIQFTSTAISEQTPVFTVTSASDSAAPDILSPSNFSPYSTGIAALASAYPRPPDKGSSLLSICSTILLI